MDDAGLGLAPVRLGPSCPAGISSGRSFWSGGSGAIRARSASNWRASRYPTIFTTNLAYLPNHESSGGDGQWGNSAN